MILPDKKFWEVFKETPGALSCAEAIAIMNIAATVPKSIHLNADAEVAYLVNSYYIELGTHKGKSAMSAIPFLKNGYFYLVDPIFIDHDLILNIATNIEKITSFYPYLNHNIDFVPTTSENALNEYTFGKMFSYVFVDSGSHGDGLPMQEAKLLEDRIVKGGIIAWHDCKNQFLEVEQAYNYLLRTGKYEEIKIDWNPIFEYVKEHNLEDGNNSWHLYPELPHPPNFLGAIRRI